MNGVPNAVEDVPDNFVGVPDGIKEVPDDDILHNDHLDYGKYLFRLIVADVNRNHLIAGLGFVLKDSDAVPDVVE